VVLVDGELVWFLERGGRSLLNFSTDGEAQRAAAGTLAELVGSGRIGGVLVEKLDGVSVLETAAHPDRKRTADALVDAGFSRTPRGLRLR
jgi:ATP-dependent Lhr-like helicase